MTWVVDSPLPPSLVICLLRLCLNLGEENDTMDSSISSVVDIAEDFIQDLHSITEPHISFII